MEFAAFVAGVGLGEIDAELGSAGGDVFFALVDEGTVEGNFFVGAFGDGGGHGGHEGLAAIGVDGVVAGVGGDGEGAGAGAFGEAGGDGEHDAIAEGDDGLLHGKLFVVAIGNFAAGFEKIGGEELVHETEGNRFVPEAEIGAVGFGEGDFAVVVLGAVIEADAGEHGAGGGGVVKGDDGIHPAAH